MNNSIWFNIHIPKCAGSSFVSILKRNFRAGFADGRSFDPVNKYGEAETQQILKIFSRIRCFSDHKFTYHLPYDRPEYHVRGIAFVREPTERFISHYFYCRHNSQGDFDPLAKQLDITAYTRAVIQDQNRVGLVNGQTYHLMGDRSSQYFQQNFELLKQRIEQQQLLLFPVSRFDEACMLLEHLFPEDFHDCAYIRQNISDKDQSVTDSVREMIYSSMTLDYQLLELANIQTNQLIASTFASEVEKQTQNLKFEQRCQKLQHQLNSPWRRIKQLGLRTTQRLLDDSPELKAFVQ